MGSLTEKSWEDHGQSSPPKTLENDAKPNKNRKAMGKTKSPINAH